MPLDEIKPDDLAGVDLPRMIFVRVRDAYTLLWERNPKLHNIGEIMGAVQKYGMQELPKFDSTLGAFKAGNGRVESVYLMEKDGNYPVPRGIGVLPDGVWCMPVLIGTDAESVDLAMAYAIDSNNLTLTGGNFSVYDITRMWDESQFILMSAELAARDTFSVSMDADTVDSLIRIGKRNDDIRGFLDDLVNTVDGPEGQKDNQQKSKNDSNPYVNLLFTASETQRDYVLSVLSRVRDQVPQVNTMLQAIIYLCEGWESENG